MNSRRQFRVLYGEFLFGLMDVELLSASARGDASNLLGQFGALLIFGSLVLSYGAITFGRGIGRAGLPGPLWTAERFLISLTMLVVGVFAVLNWDSTFPDRRDVLVLAPLPIRGRTLFAAKSAATASALGLVVAAWNSMAGFAWPMALAPDSFGFFGVVRYVAAFWATVAAAGAFLYCAVLAVQAAAAQLPRRWYLRVSPVLQIGAFVLFLGVICFQPSFRTAAALGAPQNQPALAWLPSYWFMGLLSELGGVFAREGHAVMAPLAYRAVAGLAVALCAAGGAFLLSYLRTLRKIVEEPDIVTTAGRARLGMPRWGPGPETAVTQFVIRTLLRSRPHRLILAFYVGGGAAIAAIYLEGSREMTHLSMADMVRRVNGPLLVASVVMLCAWWLGTRTVFSLPLDLRANWLFRTVPAQSGAGRLAAVRRALLSLAVLPVVAGFGVMLLWFWPWGTALEHLLLLGLVGSALVDGSLYGFRKIPFTCSYLPGKSKAHMVFWFGIIPLIIAIHNAVGVEQQAMASPLAYGAMAAGLAVVALAARRVTAAGAKDSGPEIRYEEFAADELIELRLDG